MINTTLLFLLDGNRICLGMKKISFGKGKYNGVGGKVEDSDQSIKFATQREAQEEIGIHVLTTKLTKVGDIKFYLESDVCFNQHVHIFTTNMWVGEPQESDEMKPEWFNINEIPYDKMWVDDIHWLPYVLDGKYVSGKIFFNENSEIEDLQLKFDRRRV
jgi:8-oxo-dGTP pyrophosphatase MutT (NUDIX family)